MNHLLKLQELKLLGNREDIGRVILADDQFITKQQFRMAFGDLGISSKLTMFSDGKNVVEYFNELLNGIDNQPIAERKPL